MNASENVLFSIDGREQKHWYGGLKATMGGWIDNLLFFSFRVLLLPLLRRAWRG